MQLSLNDRTPVVMPFVMGHRLLVAHLPQAAASLFQRKAVLQFALHQAIEEFQKKVDERVKAVVDNVVGNLPALGRDLGALVQRIEALEKKIEALEDRKG